MAMSNVQVPEKSAVETMLDEVTEVFRKSIEHLPIPEAKQKNLIAGFRLGYRQCVIDSK